MKRRPIICIAGPIRSGKTVLIRDLAALYEISGAVTYHFDVDYPVGKLERHIKAARAKNERCDAFLFIECREPLPILREERFKGLVQFIHMEAI
jgi:hypothetical protein